MQNNKDHSIWKIKKILLSFCLNNYHLVTYVLIKIKTLILLYLGVWGWKTPPPIDSNQGVFLNGNIKLEEEGLFNKKSGPPKNSWWNGMCYLLTQLHLPCVQCGIILQHHSYPSCEQIYIKTLLTYQFIHKIILKNVSWLKYIK